MEMKATPSSTHLFLILSLFFSCVHSQGSDSCNSPLNLQSFNLPFQTNPLHCVPVWPSQSFILRYAQASQNVWNFVLSAPNRNAYVSIGFSPNGRMVGSRAIAGWVLPDGSGLMRKYFLGGLSSNQVTVEQPNQGLQLGNSSVVVRSNIIYVAFQLISSSPPSSRLIYAVGPAGRLPTGPNFQMAVHRTMASMSLNYATGLQSNTNSGSGLARSHGLLSMLGWAILMPIGAIVARYMKKLDPLWFYSHATIQSLGFILGLSGFICGLGLGDRQNSDNHKGIGIAILVMGCLQVSAMLARPDKTSKVRKYWNWYHFGVGRTLIFVAAVNVFYGINVVGNAGSVWNAGYAAFLIILFILTIILELLLRISRKQ